MLSITTNHYVLSQSTLSRKFSLVMVTTPEVVVYKNKIVAIGMEHSKHAIVQLGKPLLIPTYPGSLKFQEYSIRYIEQKGPNRFNLYVYEPSIWDFILPWAVAAIPSDYELLMIKSHLTKAFRASKDPKVPPSKDKVVLLYRPDSWSKQYYNNLKGLKSKRQFVSYSEIRKKEHDVLVMKIAPSKVASWMKILQGKPSQISDVHKRELLRLSKNTSKENLMKGILYKEDALRKHLENKLGVRIAPGAELSESPDARKLTFDPEKIPVLLHDIIPSSIYEAF